MYNLHLHIKVKNTVKARYLLQKINKKQPVKKKFNDINKLPRVKKQPINNLHDDPRKKADFC